MTDSPSDISITIDGQAVTCPKGSTLLNSIVNSNFQIETACGGQGSCHLCRVTITEGLQELPPPSRKEARALGNILLDKGIRLSCQIKVTQPIAIKLPKYESPEERRQRKQRAHKKTRT